MDPRLNVLLTENQKAEALEHLVELQHKITFIENPTKHNTTMTNIEMKMPINPPLYSSKENDIELKMLLQRQKKRSKKLPMMIKMPKLNQG